VLKAVIFDFDGVLADSEPLHLRAYQTVLGREGIELTHEDYYRRYLGFDDRGLFRALADDRGVAMTDDRIQSLIEAKSAVVGALLTSGTVMFPGAVECVRSLAARFPLAIASGALGPEIELVLQHAVLLECFKSIASASDGVRGKPAPDLYLLAVGKLREFMPVDAASCVAIEDSKWGLEAAHKAGMQSIAVTHTYPAADLQEAALVVDHLREITIPKLEHLFA